jgi:ribose transport system substrate-binding protein
MSRHGRCFKWISTLVSGAALISGCSLKTNNPTSVAPNPTVSALAVAGSAKLTGKKVGISIGGTDNHWNRTVFDTLIATVKQLGGTPIAVQAQRSPTQQVADIENLISQKPDAIVAINGDHKALDPVFKKVHDVNIPLFTVEMAHQYSINNVASDQYQVGETEARTMFEGIGGKGNVLLFNGLLQLRGCELRYNMILEVLKDYPQVHLIQPQLQDVFVGTAEDARKKMTDALQRYPKGTINAVASVCWDIPSIGAEQAIRAAGRTEIKVYGVDGDPKAVSLIADPNSPYQATVAQLPAKIGAQSAMNIAAYLAGQKLPRTTYFSPILVTKANVAQTQKQLGF